ncbi:MAG: hypothetical protein AVDCRST_MAG19-3614 [uncultured Thermomicrobiales bacterium]|uniref:Uncharacterized protein n=1 Tax=uncultured Thermomicrobiales bacterium TaxID=1645740 RepID=A0A6J4VGZ3_9BACT|nr:MAG: hypothetical protein AVDCRST_MAG19-3614 [uncultured Thermomicrobiales bacterium]
MTDRDEPSDVAGEGVLDAGAVTDETGATAGAGDGTDTGAVADSGFTGLASGNADGESDAAEEL